jgi:hypothetical protein
MKPLENKYFVAAHEPGAVPLANVIVEIFVCLMHWLESTVVGHGRVTNNMIDL